MSRASVSTRDSTESSTYMYKRIPHIAYIFSVLLLVSCSKAQPLDVALTELSFAVDIDRQIFVKSAHDGEGNCINRCVLELYCGGQFYLRREVQYSGSASFANVPVVSDRTYKALFWADCGGENLSDEYYVTNITDKGLQQIEAINEGYFGNKDDRDAFCASVDVTVSMSSDNAPMSVILKRPFAQINVIATDATSENLPEQVHLTYSAPKGINLLTGNLLELADFQYTADVFSSEITSGEAKLSMDYIFAPENAEQRINLGFSVLREAGASVPHYLTNIPYRRGYKTNVRGALLTADTANIE